MILTTCLTKGRFQRVSEQFDLMASQLQLKQILQLLQLLCCSAAATRQLGLCCRVLIHLPHPAATIYSCTFQRSSNFNIRQGFIPTYLFDKLILPENLDHSVMLVELQREC